MHRKQDPKAKFDERTEEELDALYPIELIEPMSDRLNATWRGKQLGSAIAALKEIPTYKDDAADLWFMEQNKRVAIKEQESVRKQEHRQVKVFATSRMRRAQRVAKQQSSNPLNSIPVTVN